MAFLKVNGVEIPTPASCNYSIEDLLSDGEGRSLDGTMYFDCIAKKVKLSCSWPPMPPEEAARLLQAVGETPTFPVEYFDLVSGSRLTKNFYVSSKSAPYLRWDEGHEQIGNLAFDFMEV